MNNIQLTFSRHTSSNLEKSKPNNVKEDISSKTIDQGLSMEEKIKLFQRYNQDILKNISVDKSQLFFYEFQKCNLSQVMWSFLDRFPSFSPYSKAVIGWDILQIAALFILLFTYPLIFSLKVDFDNNTIVIFSVLVLADMVIKLNVGFFDMDTFIVSKKKICERYFRQGFLVDFIGNISIVFYLFSNSQESPIILLILAKSQSITKLLFNVEEIFFHNFQIRNWLKLLKLILAIALFSHLFACSWAFVGGFDYPLTWIKQMNLDKEGWEYIYAKSLFFSLVTMITIGYGDITPTNYTETIFVSIVAVLACGMFGYSLNQIGVIFNDVFRPQEKVRENIAIMSMYMKKKKISTPLQFKIRQYLQFYWNENKVEEQEKEQEIKQILSQQLQEELILDENKLVLQDAKILVDNFSEATMKKIPSLIKHLHCTPEEVIFQEGEDEDQNLYFIEEGSCEIFLESEKKQVLHEIPCGQPFGALGFFTGFSRTCSVRSKGFCTLLYIKRLDFMQICSQSQEDFERFCQIKDKLLFENELSTIQSRCYCCKDQTHSLFECHVIHHNNRTNFLNKIKIDQGTIHRFRIKQNIFPKLKFKALSNLNAIQQLHQRFFEDNQTTIAQYEKDNYFDIISDLYFRLGLAEEEEGGGGASFIEENEHSYNIDTTSHFIKQVGNAQIPNLSQQNQDNYQFSFNRLDSHKNPNIQYPSLGFNSNFKNASFQQNQQIQHMSFKDQKQFASFPSLTEEQVKSLVINGNVYPAVEPNYFFNLQQQNMKKISPQKQHEDTFFSKVQQGLISEEQKKETVINIIPSNTIQSEYQFSDRQGTYNTQKSLSNAEVRSRNNSALTNISNISVINQKSQQFFSKFSSNFIDFNVHEQSQVVQDKQEKETSIEQNNMIEKLIQGKEDSGKDTNYKIQNNTIQLSPRFKDLLPYPNKGQLNKKGTVMLSVMLALKRFSRKVKSKFQKVEKQLHNQTSQNNQGSPNSKVKRYNSNEEVLDLQFQSSEIFFCLMHHRNISQYSATQKFLDYGFERMQDYLHYYPFGNSDVIMKMISFSHDEKALQYQKILMIKKTENKRSKSFHLNNISRLKQKYQEEQNSEINNSHQKNVQVDQLLSFESFSSFHPQINQSKLQRMQRSSQVGSSLFVHQEATENHTDSKTNINNNMQQSFTITDSTVNNYIGLSPIATSSLGLTSPTPYLKKKQMKSKYYSQHEPEINIVNQEILEMERDLNSVNNILRENSIHNISFNNQPCNEYLTEF